MGYIRDLFLRNLLLKLISLFFAIVLWVNLSPVGSRNTLEVNYVLPLELKNIPENMMTMGKIENHISVRVKGSQAVIKEIPPGKLSVTIDLSKAKEGVNFYKLNSDNIVNIPPKIDVVRIEPNIVKIKMVKLIRKELDLKVIITGKPAPGYKIKNVNITPSKIIVEGPEKELKTFNNVKEIAINVDGANRSFSKEVRITLPLYNVKIIGNTIATIHVEVEKG